MISKLVQEQGVCRSQKLSNNKKSEESGHRDTLRVPTNPLASTLMASWCDVTCRESPGTRKVKPKRAAISEW